MEYVMIELGLLVFGSVDFWLWSWQVFNCLMFVWVCVFWVRCDDLSAMMWECDTGLECLIASIYFCEFSLSF